MALARWRDLCMDATDARRLGEFWGAMLGLDVEHLDDGDVRLTGAHPWQTIWVNTVPEGKVVKHRVHLDCNAALLDPIVDLGATVLLPASESGFPWTVLADPEGGEFCVFLRDDQAAEPPATLLELIVDVTDSDSSRELATWWADVLGARVVDDGRGFWWVEDIPDQPFESIDFVPVPEGKAAKNRIHWDVACDDLPELLARGATVLATPAEGTGWHVCADPQGNEFCVFPSS